MDPNKAFDLAFIDVETTGLDASQDEILELAVVRLNPRTLEEVGRYHRYFLPSRPVPPEVAKINGYDPTLWLERGARVMTSADLDDLDLVLAGAAFAGQNPAFDRGFVTAAYARYSGPPLTEDHGWWPGLPASSRRPPPMDYHLIDVASLAWPLAVGGFVPGLSLRHTRKYFGLPGEQTHTALGDVEDTIHVYKALMEVYMAALLVDSIPHGIVEGT